MSLLKKCIRISFFFFLLPFLVEAQEGTRTNTTAGSTQTGKIMIVPFEPKLYMSEIDQKVNQQTKWNFNQIRENFRHQLDTQLKLKLQSIAPVVSFYSDSSKMTKDLEYTYLSSNLSYDPVNEPSTATAPTKKQDGIKNGQVAVEINTDKKFMNTKLSSVEVLNYLNKKYKVEYFVFVNELDITTLMDSYNIASDTYQRQVAVHYSILDKTGKTISAGLATSTFSSKENNPKKIVSSNFTPIAAFIASKLNAIINPPKEK